MDARYPRFAVTDPTFYDRPGRREVPAEARYHPDPGCDWSLWQQVDDGDWSFWAPPGVILPEQGWKIHVSTTPADAVEVLRSVSASCHHRELAFKHLPHSDALGAVNGKDADRASAGKFLTLYPRDETELHEVLVDLDAKIGGRAGPYVLSDLRWNSGPLYVRYGAYARRTLVRDGIELAGLRDPSTGELVEDVRTTAFAPPPWISLPPFLQASGDALRDTAPPAGFPHVTAALHHSNAGGVYLADDEGETVVLKEARPFSGLTPDGRDAVERLRHEEAVLRSIRLPSVPRVRRSMTLHGHDFLVLERVIGEPLSAEVVRRNPRVRAGATAADRRAYRDWALEVTSRVRAEVDALHAAGYTHGDLHPGNVLVRPDGTIALLDFEMARPVADDAPPVVGAPGFVPPDGRGGIEHDRYALACIELFVFCPLTALLPLDAQKAGDLSRAAERAFELPPEWATAITRALRVEHPSPAATSVDADEALRRFELDTVTALQPAIAATVAQLLADAETDRSDRAWPGDPAQFAEAPYTLAHGAAGVAFGLDTAGVEPGHRVREWLDSAIAQDAAPPPGLYNGLAGVVHAHRRAQRHDAADRALHLLRGANLDRLGEDLYGGLPGVGLVLLSESEADATLLPLVDDVAARLRLADEERGPREPGAVATGTGGLLRGRSGTALFAVQLYERTGDPAHLRLAQRAMADDLTTLTASPDGSLQVDEGWRGLPYLGSGSAGIGVVLAQLLEHTPDSDRYLEALEGIRRAASTGFVIQGGLFTGRAGLIHFLLVLARRGLSTPDSDAALARHVRELRLHGIRRPAGIGFAGDGLLRLSCDFATGSAGVLSALAAYQAFLSGEEPSRTGLPFLTPPAASARAWPSLAGHLTERG